MKPYLSSFLLLLLLLLNQSLSATAGLPLGPLVKGITKGLVPIIMKGITKGLRSSAGEEIAKDLANYLKNITQQSSPQPPDASPELIQGLYRIKQYLNNYGYLQSSASEFNDYLDRETRSAIQSYQKFFNLEVTGDLNNNQILEHLSYLRCAVPDVNIQYNFTDSSGSWPKAGNRWFRNTNLTYGFHPDNQIPESMTKLFRDSFTRWALASGVLNLTETTYDNANIQVGFYNFTSMGIEVEVYGGSIISLQPPSNATTGVLLLDGATMFWALPSENDTLSWEDGVLDLESAAMHQIGHLLGLDHSSMNDSVMYPYILPSQQRKVELSVSDEENIQQQQYITNNGDAGHGGRWGVLSVTTFSLGFAYVLLLLY